MDRSSTLLFTCRVLWNSWTQTFSLPWEHTLLTLLEAAAVWKLLLYGKFTKDRVKTPASPSQRVTAFLSVFTRQFLGPPIIQWLKCVIPIWRWIWQSAASVSKPSLLCEKHMQPFKHCVYFQKTSQLSWTVYLQQSLLPKESFRWYVAEQTALKYSSKSPNCWTPSSALLLACNRMQMEKSDDILWPGNSNSICFNCWMLLL